MAGPTASVHAPRLRTADGLAEFRPWLAEFLTAEEDSNWWMLQDGRRLEMEGTPPSGSMLIEPMLYQSEDADEAASLSDALGFLPDTEVVLAAAVNGKNDHRFLAHLTVAIARRYITASST